MDELPKDAPFDKLDRSYGSWCDWFYYVYQDSFRKEENGKEIFDRATRKKYWDIYWDNIILPEPLKDGFKTIWHRDIAAARCILYVGE